MNNLMSETQKTKALTWDELKNMDSSFTESRGHALYSIFTKIPPRRPQDYRVMKIGKANATDNNFNYLVLSTPVDLDFPHFIFNRYKTATKKGYGKYIATIPDDLAVVLKKYIDDYDIKDGDFLFKSFAPKTKDQTYDSSTFSLMISGIFHARTGKKMDVNSIRHAYATHILSEKISMNELEKIAKAMGTSRNELMNTYNKLDL
jgi:integrase